MNLPFFSKNNSKVEYYLGLFLKEEEGTVLVITKNEGKIEVRENEKFSYSNGWESLDSDIDEVLYRVEKKIDRNLDKTIFFVYSHLVDEKAGDIKKPYLQKIKMLVKNLELTPIGYIECYEAVASVLEKREGTPVNGILVEIDSHDLSLFVYKGGKITFRNSLAKTDNIALDLIKGMDELKGKLLLPSRIILYNSHDLDASAEKILSHHWGEDFFIQLPRVDILGEEEVIGGLTDIFGVQIGGNEIMMTSEKRDETKTQQESFGFLMNQDVAELAPIQPEPVMAQDIDLPLKKTNFTIPKVDLSFLSGLKNIPNALKGLPSILTGKATIIVGMVIIILSLFLNEYFFHKADLKIYLSSEKITKEAVFDLDYTIASSSASFSQSTATTGQRQIGDPARGEVVVHNFEDDVKTFAKGTVIDTAGIKFVLDTEVKVASSSLASDGSAKLPGKEKVSVTSSAIGPESNISKGKRFNIEGESPSVFFAINEANFAGGSRRSVRTVAEEDMEKLDEAIIKLAKEEVKLPKGAKGELVSNLTETTLSESEYSAEVGEESDTLSLKADAVTTFYLYNRRELLDKILDLTKDQVRSGFEIEESFINYKFSDAEVEGDKVKLSTAIDARAVKKAAKEDIMSTIIGRGEGSLEELLKGKFSIEGYDLKITSPVPFLKKNLPFFKQNINLTITTL